MEKIKKEILQKVKLALIPTDESVNGYVTHNSDVSYYTKYGESKYAIVPDLDAVYNIKINLNSNSKDLGFFDIVEYNPSYYPYYYGDNTLPIGLLNLFD